MCALIAWNPHLDLKNRKLLTCLSTMMVSTRTQSLRPGNRGKTGTEKLNTLFMITFWKKLLGLI